MRRALLALCVVAALPGRAEAWNPLRAAADKIAAAGRAIGGVLGAPAGGFIESATTPVLHNLEGMGHRLVGDLDTALDRNLDRAGELIDKVERTADATATKIDHSLAARILQVQTGLDQTLDRVLGRVEADARDLLAQAARTGAALIQQIDKVAADRLKQVDDILTHQVRDLHAVVSSSIEQADDVARARIEQLDEMAERRLGNLDAIATKQSLGFEGMLVRLSTLLAVVGLTAFVAWRLFRELADAMTDASQRGASRIRAIGWRSLTRLAPQLALAGAGVVVLLVLADRLPHSSQDRAQQQVENHKRALASAADALDLSTARYHESQLEILASDNLAIDGLALGDRTPGAKLRGDLPRLHGAVQKAALLLSLFSRPGQLHNQKGLADLVAQVGAVEAAIGTGDDPDVLIAKAYILWQVGGSRDDEYDAAVLCAQALAHGGAPRLAPLARNYLALFLADPYTPRDAAGLAGVVAAAQLPAARGETEQFAQLIDFDRRITELDRASTAAYLDMLDAQADLQIALRKAPRGGDSPAARGARDARTRAAGRVIEAWTVFDRGLEAAPYASDAMVLSVFTLDDAVLTHARYWDAVPGANDLPPALARLADDRTNGAALLRARIAPIRVAWDRRYAPLLGPREREVVAYQETQRFAAFERRAGEFAQAYVAFAVDARTAAAPGQLLASASLAATRAAGMSLYRDTPSGRIREAQRILAIAAERGQQATAQTLAIIAQHYQIRRLRLL